ncbi:PCYCGC motif-containing (lipo)protein [Tumebacillus lipolyticus]|uniref:PCYCGC motif-containing (Lipo)protein n=1 Tax=Tumebacillus lipolyticus TaxID=1280370 RepID=A0ABW5A134_9BACL
MKKLTKIMVASLLTLTVATGCGTTEKTAQNDEHAGHDHPATNNGGSGSTGHPAGAQAEAYKTLKVGESVKLTTIGDLQEATANKTSLPAFLMNKNAKMKDSYKAAVENVDILQYIPCYCGCGEHAGHMSNAECFVRDVRPDGVVVWDDHGTRCDTCMNIALKAAEMKEEGKTVKEIRTYIDEKYKKGYAKPTPTPMPS